MSSLVIDASITLGWLLPDETSEMVVAVREDELLKAETVWVPAHWRLEVCNSLWMAERRKRLDSAGVSQATELFLKLPVTIDSETNDRAGRETLSLARHHGLSVYDAAYLELVLRQNASLVSLDGPLRLVAAKLGVSVLPKRIKEDK